jgi:hypothetical protein
VVSVHNTASVAHQATGPGEFGILKDRGYRAAEQQCAELFAPANKEPIIAYHEPACLQLDQGCEYRIEVAFAACVQDLESQARGHGPPLARLLGAV